MKINSIYMVAQPPDKASYWTTNLFTGAQKEAAKRNVTLTLLESVQALETKGASIAILAGHSLQWFQAATARCEALGVRPLLVSGQTPMDECFSSVSFAMQGAMRKALAYLQQAGRTRVALVGTNPDSPADSQKMEVFVREAGELGFFNHQVFPCGSDGMVACVEKLAFSAQRFDAVIAANDVVAICLMRTLEARGVRVPQDHYVIGMGNSNIGRMVRPPLTSIDFDYSMLGAYAIDLALRLSSEPQDVHFQVHLPCRFVIRESTDHFQLSGVAMQQEAAGETNSAYYRDQPVSQLNNLEALLQQCDESDLKILDGVLRGKTYAQIAAESHFSERTIKYRVQKLLARAGLTHRSQLKPVFQELWWTEGK